MLKSNNIRPVEFVDYKRRYFSHYENNTIYCFPLGQTSWSNKTHPTFDDCAVKWNYGKLAERGKIKND